MLQNKIRQIQGVHHDQMSSDILKWLLSGKTISKTVAGNMTNRGNETLTRKSKLTL